MSAKALSSDVICNKNQEKLNLLEDNLKNVKTLILSREKEGKTEEETVSKKPWKTQLVDMKKTWVQCMSFNFGTFKLLLIAQTCYVNVLSILGIFPSFNLQRLFNFNYTGFPYYSKNYVPEKFGPATTTFLTYICTISLVIRGFTLASILSTFYAPFLDSMLS